MGFSSENISLSALAPSVSEFRADDIAALTTPGPSLDAIITEQWMIAFNAPIPAPEYGFVVWDVSLTGPALVPSTTAFNGFSAELASAAPTISVDMRKANATAPKITAPGPALNVKIVPATKVSIKATAPKISVSVGAANQIDISLAAAAPTIAAAAARFYNDTKVRTVVAVNAKNGAVGVFSGFNFESFALYQGQIYGIDSSGLKTIGGPKDGSSWISSSAKFHKSNLGSTKHKRVRKAVISGADTGYDPTITISSGEKSASHLCEFVDGMESQSVEVIGRRDIYGDTMSVEVSSDRPLDVEAVDIIFKKIR